MPLKKEEKKILSTEIAEQTTSIQDIFQYYFKKQKDEYTLALSRRITVSARQCASTHKFQLPGSKPTCLIKNIPCNKILELLAQLYLKVQHTMLCTYNLLSETQNLTTTSTTSNLLKVALIKQKKQFFLTGNPFPHC